MLLSAPGYAQVVIPGSVAPSLIEQQFQQPLAPVAPVMEPTPQAPVPHTAVASNLAEQFTLKKVIIDDVTVYNTSIFDPLYKNKLGQRITLSEAREMARAITAHYRADGYVLSQAVIPKQDLTKGTMRIRVIEGFIDKVSVENDHPDSDRRHLIEDYGHKINAMRPLNIKTLERYMLLINDLPGVTARAVLRPSPDTQGAADLVIKVSNKAADGSFTSDNRGNKFLGPYQEQLALSENSALGLDERTSIRGINTIPFSDLHFFDLENEEQIGSEGTKLTLLYSNTYSHPGDRLKPLDFQGTSDDYSITVSQPFLRSRAQNFTGRITFDARDTENDSLGERLTNDRVRAFRLGGSYDTGDTWGGIDAADISVSQGVPWLEATGGDGTTSPDGLRDFTKENLSLSRVQSMPYGFSLLTAGEGQYSAHPLYTSEQLALGGVGFGQAYDTGEISGDSGLASRIELRYDQSVGQHLFNSYQLYSYYDIGVLWLDDTVPGIENQLSLASAGVGVRANFTPNLYGYVEAGLPLTREVGSEENKNPRLFFSVTARF